MGYEAYLHLYVRMRLYTHLLRTPSRQVRIIPLFYPIYSNFEILVKLNLNNNSMFDNEAISTVKNLLTKI